MANKYFKSLMIEPTNICNLHCPVCPVGAGIDKREKGFMEFHQFKKIIDENRNFLECINLWNYGEPFLAPDIMKMINYTGENNITVTVHTNGTVLNKKILDKFKKNYKLRISFSIDGLTQKTYSYYRVGGNLKNVLNNLSYLANLKKKFNLFNLLIIWQFLVMKTNEHEIDKVFEAAKRIGVDRLRLKTIGINKEHSRYNDFVPKNENYRRRIKKENKNIDFSGCLFINPGMPTILLNGDVVPCCYDYFGEHVFKKNLLDIWDSQEYRKFREDYKNGQNVFCNNRCNWNKKLIYIKEFNFNKR